MAVCASPEQADKVLASPFIDLVVQILNYPEWVEIAASIEDFDREIKMLSMMNH